MYHGDLSTRSSAIWQYDPEYKGLAGSSPKISKLNAI